MNPPQNCLFLLLAHRQWALTRSVIIAIYWCSRHRKSRLFIQHLAKHPFQFHSLVQFQLIQSILSSTLDDRAISIKPAAYLSDPKRHLLNAENQPTSLIRRGSFHLKPRWILAPKRRKRLGSEKPFPRSNLQEVPLLIFNHSQTGWVQKD